MPKQKILQTYLIGENHYSSLEIISIFMKVKIDLGMREYPRELIY